MRAEHRSDSLDEWHVWIYGESDVSRFNLWKLLFQVWILVSILLPSPPLLRVNRSGVVVESCSYFWVVGARRHTAPRDVRLVLGLVRELGDWRCFFGDVYGGRLELKLDNYYYRNNLFKYYFIFTYDFF